MKSELEPILKVQSIDLEVIDTKSQIESIPIEVEKLKKHKDEQKNALALFEEDTKKQKLTQKQLEGDIESQKERVKKLEIQLNAIKTNSEYTKMLKEIENAKSVIAETEDSLIGIMEVLESKEDEKQLKVNEVKELENDVQKQIDEQHDLLNNLKTRLIDLEKQRKESKSLCSGALFRKYELFMKKKHSIVLVPLEKNGACSGCHRHLPPNIRNEVMKGKILQCDNCARLIFWEAETEVEKSKEESEEKSNLN